MRTFVRAGHTLVRTDTIARVDCARLEQLAVTIHHAGGVDVATGLDALDVVSALRPSALEGKRLRFARHAWAVHNLIGHPLLQLCVWLGLRELGFAIHDATVPVPGLLRAAA
jgi:hypothetical protein